MIRVQCKYPCRAPDALCPACDPVLRVIHVKRSARREKESERKAREAAEREKRALEAFLALIEESADSVNQSPGKADQ